MQLLTALVLLSSAASTLAVPTNFQYTVYEKVNAPSGWRQIRKADSSRPITLKIHLTQQNVAAFEKMVYDISTPGHELYGKHMSRAQVKAMLSPSKDTVSAVSDWIKSLGLGDSMTIEDDWIHVDTNVAAANQLLKADYQVYGKGEKDGQVRTLSYSLPQHLHEHINLVHPTVVFGGANSVMKTQVKPAPPQLRRRGKADNCASSITPACLRTLYDVGTYKITNPAKAGTLAVSGYLEQYAQNSDLTKFASKYMGGVKPTFQCTGVNGGLCTQNPSEDFTEANLDIQYTEAMTYPMPNVYLSTAGRPPLANGTTGENDNEPYLDFANWLSKQSPLPHTLTTSYGEPESTVPLNYMQTVCNLFAQLGAQGVSIMFSSGDSGPGDTCRKKDGTKWFEPTFPAGCPFVTAVGGTTGVPEKAVGLSSGGFSDTFPMPDYQKDAIAGWSKTSEATTNKPYFSAAGRGIPDVSAQGANYHVYVGGSDQLVSGTSASSPAFAGIIGLINGDRVSSGKPPMGFLNPWIYGVGKTGFKDVTSGSSRGCSGSISGAKWSAVAGWDPVTGMGVASFSAMLKSAQAYSPPASGRGN